MNNVEKVSIKVGTSIYNTYKRLKQTFSGVFREFVDNSTQSFNDHKEELVDIGVEKCIVNIDINNYEVIITDNAYGMSKNDFQRSLKLNAPAKKYSDKSRSQFGMGLKYASMYLGDIVNIESTSFGSNELYSATLNSSDLEKNIDYIDMFTSKVDENIHYTKITIRKLRHELNISDIDKLIYELGKIYKRDIKNENLKIVFNSDKEVGYIEPPLWIDEYGSEYWELFQDVITFRDKKYSFHGWVGLLETADASKDGNSGFSLVHNGRYIVINYKPKELLGKPNSFPNQRIIGEIDLDDFPVDFNKSSFTWDNGLEELFIKTLKSNKTVSSMIRTATILRKLKNKKNSNKVIVDKKNLNKKTEKRFENLNNVSKEKNKNDVLKVQKNISIETYEKGDLEEPIKINYNNKDYKIYIKYDNTSNDKKWIKLEKRGEEIDNYNLIVNINYNIFSSFSKANIETLEILTVAIALAQLASIEIGAESHKMTEIINDIINRLG